MLLMLISSQSLTVSVIPSSEARDNQVVALQIVAESFDIQRLLLADFSGCSLS